MGKLPAYFFLVITIFSSLTACSSLNLKRKFYSTVTLNYNSEENINDGALLPIDIITVDKSVSAAVLDVGPDNWFGDSLRDRLTEQEVQHLAIKGGTTREVKINVPEGVTKIIIYADYENNIDRTGQQIVINSEKLTFLPKYNIKLKESKMEISE